MHFYGSLLVGRFHQAENFAFFIIEPVTDVVYTVLFLCFKILLVGINDRLGWSAPRFFHEYPKIVAYCLAPFNTIAFSELLKAFQERVYSSRNDVQPVVVSCKKRGDKQHAERKIDQTSIYIITKLA